jgi:hypothetical protein
MRTEYFKPNSKIGGTTDIRRRLIILLPRNLVPLRKQEALK